MDGKLASLIAKLDRCEASHPNLASLWREFIRKKFNNLLSTIDACNETIDMMDSVPDLSCKDILSLHYILSILNSREE